MNQIKFIKNYNNKVPSWQTILNNFNDSVENGGLIRSNDTGFFLSHEGHLIPEVQEVLKDLKLRIAHVYISLSSKGTGFGRHQDDVDVYFWQAQGSTKWEGDCGNIWIVEPGDLIIIPKYIFHNVTPLSPRVGISMSFD